MNMFPVVSVIVPVYNVEKYLSDCIDSILAQKYENFELLLIDDGSRDNSGKICDKYASADSRIRVFHKVNDGVGSARNMGIDNARGKWIVFIDADDKVKENYLDSFFVHSHNLSERTVVYQIGYVLRNTPGEDSSQLSNYKRSIYKDDELINFLFENNCFLKKDGSSYCTLFNLNVLKQNEIRFLDHNSAYEDVVFNLRYVAYMDEVVLVNCFEYIYYRRWQEQSLSKKRHPFSQYIESFQYGMSSLDLFINRHSIEKEYMKDCLFEFVYGIGLTSWSSLFHLQRKISKEEILYLRKNLIVPKVKLHSVQNRILLLPYKLPLPLSYFLVNIYIYIYRIFKSF